MTLVELFRRFRSDVDDVTSPYLWSDADLEVYFNWALEQLATRAHYFYDQNTWAALPVTAGDAKITATSGNRLSKILIIRRARLVSQTQRRDLKVCTMEQASQIVLRDDYGSRSSYSWEDTTGTPYALITDYYTDSSLRLGPIPGAVDTLSLWASRLPLSYYTLDSCGSVDLEDNVKLSNFSHQLTIIEGMKARAYLKEDPETIDTRLAADAQTTFISEVSDLKQERERKFKPPGVVRYGGL